MVTKEFSRMKYYRNVTAVNTKERLIPTGYIKKGEREKQREREGDVDEDS